MIASNVLEPSIGKTDPENIDEMVLSDINVTICSLPKMSFGSLFQRWPYALGRSRFQRRLLKSKKTLGVTTHFLEIMKQWLF